MARNSSGNNRQHNSSHRRNHTQPNSGGPVRRRRANQSDIPPPTEQNSNSGRDVQDRLNFNERLTFIVAVVGAIVSILGLVNSCSDKTMGNAVKELTVMAAADQSQTAVMADQFSAMQAQANAAQGQITVMAKQNAITTSILENSKDTAARQLRAYVTAKPGRFTWVDDKSPIKYEFGYSNVGNTPAYDLTVFLNYSTMPLDYTLTCPVTNFSNFRQKLVLGSGESLSSYSETSNNFVTQEMLADIKASKTALIVNGTIIYSDTYGQSWRQDFCFFHTGEDWQGSGRYWNSGNGTEAIKLKSR